MGIEQGILQEAKGMLLLLGERRLGPPEPATRSAVEPLTDRKKIEGLTQHLQDVGSWQELLR